MYLYGGMRATALAWVSCRPFIRKASSVQLTGGERRLLILPGSLRSCQNRVSLQELSGERSQDGIVVAYIQHLWYTATSRTENLLKHVSDARLCICRHYKVAVVLQLHSLIYLFIYFLFFLQTNSHDHYGFVVDAGHNVVRNKSLYHTYVHSQNFYPKLSAVV